MRPAQTVTLKRSGTRRRFWGGLAVVLACAVTAPTRVAGAELPLETAVKATYLYKFAPFIQWPAGAFEGESGPLMLCVVGSDPFGAFLDRAVAGQRVDGRPVLLRRLATANGQDGCHIMFIGGSRAQSVAQALKAVHGAPVFTVTDDSGSRAMADFTVSEGRVRFRLDDQTASEAGLSISSKLLSLAVAVTPRRSR